MLILRPDRCNRRRGSALATSLIVVVLAAAMSAAMLQVQTGMSSRQKQSTNNKRALYIAEAGLSEAFIAITQGKSGNVGTADVPAAFGDGVFWVEATEQADNKIALVSNGLCGTGRYSLGILVQKQVNTVASLGMCGDQEMSVGAGVVLDGYNSASGTFETQASTLGGVLTTGTGASVNSNSNISVLGPANLLGVPLGPVTKVYGSAHPGPNKTVTTQPNATVTGSTSPNLKSLSLPQIVVPTLTSQGSMVLTSTQKIENQEIRYDSIRVGRNAKLEIKGPAIVVIGSLILDGLSKLEFDTSAGSVTVYVTNCISWAANSTISSKDRDPKNVALLVSAGVTADWTGDGVADPPVSIAASGELASMFYAPNATVTMPSSLRVFGAVTAKKLTYATGSRSTYDSALVTSTNILKGLPTIVSWQIVELPDTPLVRSNADALTVLQREGVVLIKSSNSHKEDKINITYTDSSGTVQRYNGPASAFNFTIVRRVIDKVWSKN